MQAGKNKNLFSFCEFITDAQRQEEAQAKRRRIVPPQKGGTVGDIITFLIEPVPKGRPRFRVFNGRVSTFTPRKTRVYESDIAEMYVNQRGKKYDAGVPLEVLVNFYMPIPKRASKIMRSHMQNGYIKHTKKPDVDNLTKALLDALNGIAFADDAQIVRLSAQKMYGEVPRIELLIKVAGGEM